MFLREFFFNVNQYSKGNMIQFPDFFSIAHKWYAAIGSQLQNMSLKKVYILK